MKEKKQGWAIGSYSPIWAKLDFILRSPAREVWAKPMKGFKVMFSLTNVCQRKMHHLGFWALKICLANMFHLFFYHERLWKKRQKDLLKTMMTNKTLCTWS